MSLVNRAVQSLKWSTLAELASKAIAPLVLIILARILSPEDFGVVAAATVVVSFTQVLWDAGLAKTLVQRRQNIEQSALVVFWLNLGLSAALFVCLLGVSGYIARLFHDQRIAEVVQVLALQVPIAALSSVQAAMLRRQLDFKKLFWVRFFTVALPSLASVPLALIGAGYWALVAGTVAGQLVQTVALWHLSAWRPRWYFDKELAIDLFSFGKWVLLSGVLGWFYNWADVIVIGAFLGPHDMGLYRTGNALILLIFGLAFSPLLPVLYSVFSQVQDDLEKLKRALMTVVRSIAILSLPLAFGIFAVREQIEVVVFGGQWVGIATVIGVLALSHGLGWVVGANGEVYRAIGKPHLETWAMITMLGIYLIGYLFAVQYGLFVFLVTRLGLSFVALAVHIGIASRYFSLSPGQWLSALTPALAASLAMFAMLHFVVINIMEPSPLGLLGAVGLGGIAYSALIFVLEKRFLAKLRLLLVAKKTV